jgi:hypothetical protein
MSEQTKQDFEQWVKLAKHLFPEATALASLEKLREETSELERVLLSQQSTPAHHEITKGMVKDFLLEEAADCLMCLLHIVGTTGASVEEFLTAFRQKSLENRYRCWVKNKNGTYSHA